MIRGLRRLVLAIVVLSTGACGSSGGGGAAGSTGAAGAAGSTGTAGATAGSTGAAGAVGSTGTAGATGAAGAAGSTGAAGAAGASAGSTGAAGADAAAGAGGSNTDGGTDKPVADASSEAAASDGGAVPAPYTWVSAGVTYNAYQPGTKCMTALGFYSLVSQSPNPNYSLLSVYTKAEPTAATTYDCVFPPNGDSTMLTATQAFLTFNHAGTYYCSGGKINAALVGGKVTFTFVDVPVAFASTKTTVSGNVGCF